MSENVRTYSRFGACFESKRKGMNTKESLILRQRTILEELDGINNAIDDRYNSWSNQITTPCRKFLETFTEAELIKSFTDKLTAYNKNLYNEGVKITDRCQLYVKDKEPIFKWAGNIRGNKISGYRNNALALVEEFNINAVIVYPALETENVDGNEPTLGDKKVFGRSADLNTYVPYAVGLLAAFVLYKRYKK